MDDWLASSSDLGRVCTAIRDGRSRSQNGGPSRVPCNIVYNYFNNPKLYDIIDTGIRRLDVFI